MAYQFFNPHKDSAFSLDPTDRRQARIEDEAHLAFIRKLPSLISGQQPCEACHVRYGDPKHRKRKTPTRRRPDDAWTIPMTSAEHNLQHSMNERAFWERAGIDPLEVAHQLYQVSGDLEAGRAIIEKARRSAR